MKNYRRLSNAALLAMLGGTGCGQTMRDAPPAAADAGAQSQTDASADATIDGHADAEQPKPDSPRRERCNGVDDDGDGHLDEGCPLRLTRNPASDARPTLDKGRVVWTRNTNGANGDDVFVRDLPNGAERLVASDIQRGSAAALAGDWVAFWKEPYIHNAPNHVEPKPDPGYVLINLTTGKRIDIPSTGVNHYPPVLSTDWLLWSQQDSSADAWADNQNIYKYDIPTGELSLLIDGYASQIHPVLAERYVFWSDSRNGHFSPDYNNLYELWSLDRTTGVTTQLMKRAEGETISYIQASDAGRAIVYELGGLSRVPTGTPPTYARTCQLVLYAGNGARTDLTELRQFDAYPECAAAMHVFGGATLKGDFFVHQKASTGDADLELWNLRTGYTLQLTDHPRHSFQPTFDGRYLVWVDDRNDDLELYYMDLVDLESGDIYPEGREP